MIPGRINRLVLAGRPRPGVYRGQCAEFCGAQHALMALLRRRAEPEPSSTPGSQAAARGRREPPACRSRGAAATSSSRPAAAPATPCAAREADGALGPDLTHVGSRLSLGAGALPTDAGTLAGWIADAQHLKPGNLMPSFDSSPASELRALAAYLESLRMTSRSACRTRCRARRASSRRSSAPGRRRAGWRLADRRQQHLYRPLLHRRRAAVLRPRRHPGAADAHAARRAGERPRRRTTPTTSSSPCTAR